MLTVAALIAIAVLLLVSLGSVAKLWLDSRKEGNRGGSTHVE
jgi:hypothetical protein